MNQIVDYGLDRFPSQEPVDILRSLLSSMKMPCTEPGEVGIKLHWGERGNHSFLPPVYAREIVRWLKAQGHQPFIFDTTVLYSGGRRDPAETLKTAAGNGFTPEYLECPVVVADGPDGRQVVDIDGGFKHFKTVQVASLVDRAIGYVIFSHFKGHMAAGFGGAIKNLSMGFASRAQKQRMHADVQPVLSQKKCTQCGLCAEVCPVGAAQIIDGEYPTFNLEMCIGCAQCIGMCPAMALRILWGSDDLAFQEKLLETAFAVWRKIQSRSILINGLLKITEECDCWAGKNEVVAGDYGFIGGYHPVTVDEVSIAKVGGDVFTKAHPGIRWQRQFEYAREIGFIEE